MKIMRSFMAAVAFGLCSFAALAEPLAPKQWVNDRIEQSADATHLNKMLVDANTNSVSVKETVTSNIVNLAGSNITEFVKNDLDGRYRPFGDEFVYDPGEMSDFTWSCESRPDILAVIGTLQPQYYYDYGDDYREWELNFSYNGMDYWGYGYGVKNAPLVTFSLNGWGWDPETEEYRDDYISDLVGRRTAGDYHKRVPEDTFAHNSQIQPIYTEVNQIRTLVNGEMLKQRNGGFGEYGIGPGYLSHDIRDEYRNWRFRVPKWVSIQNMTTNNLAAGSSFNLTDRSGYTYIRVSFPGSSSLYYANAVLSNPLSWLPNWDLRSRLIETRGVYSSDCCRMADYHIGLFLLAPGESDKCAIKFKVEQTAYSPMSFRITPEYEDLSPIEFYEPTKTTKAWFSERLVDVPPFTAKWAQTINNIECTNETTCTVKSIAVKGRQTASWEQPTSVTTSNGTIPLNIYTISDRTFKVYRADTGDVLYEVSTNNVVGAYTVTVTCNSNTTFMDYRAPYYKIITSNDGNKYYDAAGDSSYCINVSNGCFYTEKIMDGDWRKKDQGL